MNITGITWRGESVDDMEILRELPPDLVRILSDTNGFILHDGALHVRGAHIIPDWHSLRVALHGPAAFHTLYESVRATDIPFAQDQVGDQFVLRDGRVLRLSSETGDLEPFADGLDNFFNHVAEDIEEFLNVSLDHTMQPGQLLLAYPPFVFQESANGVSLKPVRAGEVIFFHADIARQIRDLPEGGQIEFRVVD